MGDSRNIKWGVTIGGFGGGSVAKITQFSPNAIILENFLLQFDAYLTTKIIPEKFGLKVRFFLLEIKFEQFLHGSVHNNLIQMF